MIDFNEPISKDPMYKKVYYLWHNMMSRCYNERHPAYKHYGLKGVKVSKEWKTFKGFCASIDKVQGWDRDRFLEGKLTLDKDTLGNSKLYSVNTCAFISKEENNKYKPNQQRTIIGVDPNGETYVFMNQSEFAREHGLRQSTIGDCLSGRVQFHRGWSFRYK